MEVIFSEIGQVKEKELKFAVISALYEGRWIFVQHKKRDTWEIPGGHRESGEDILTSARRELFEETGAKVFDIEAICDYGVKKEEEISYGRLFYARIKAIGELPDSEIREVREFDTLPEQLTYPKIQPHLFYKSLQYINDQKLY